MRMIVVAAALTASAALAGTAGPVRQPVLGQIALPHSYYYRELYLPQLTSGPSYITWTPDGTSLVYSMQGSLWRQRVGGDVAEQLTGDAGTDYQPDASPDGRSIVFVRYDGRAMELMLLDVASGKVSPLTSNGAVNVEPRWSPDGRRLAYVSTHGTGHFLLHVADVRDDRIVSTRPQTPDRRSAIARYYLHRPSQKRAAPLVGPHRQYRVGVEPNRFQPPRSAGGGRRSRWNGSDRIVELSASYR